MNRLINTFLLGAMIVAAVVVYNVKHGVESASVEVARLEADIENEREAIALLKAEWSHLTQPGRLQELVERYGIYFELAAVGAEQIADIDEIPVRPIDLNPNRNAPLGGYAGGSSFMVQ